MSGPAPPPVTVAVVSWNTRDLLRECLRAVHADVEAARADVWVVDNGSSDGSPGMVAQEFPWARLLEPGVNLGFGRAVNEVAARSASPWIAPANADVALAPGALEALLVAGEADPGAGVLGPRLRLPDGSIQPSVQPFPSPATTFLSLSRVHRLDERIARRLYLPGHWNPDVGARVPWVTGAFMLVRRAAWDAIGGFDAGQWMYAEDIDLCWRAAQAGWATRYVPAAEARHEHGAAAGAAFGADVDARWLGATYAWLARRRGLAVAWTTAALAAAEAAARWAALRLRGAPADRRRRARAELAAHAGALRGRAALARRR